MSRFWHVDLRVWNARFMLIDSRSRHNDPSLTWREFCDEGWGRRIQLGTALRGGRMETSKMKKSKPSSSWGIWTLQVFLALFFLFAGVMKFIMPVQQMIQNTPFSGGFMHFIGAAEIVGAFGLVLPGLLKIWRGLTPLAAAGLLVIVIGATITTVLTLGAGPAVLPFVTCILVAIVARKRWNWLRPTNTPEKAGDASPVAIGRTET